MLRKQGGNGRTHLSRPTLWFITKNPCGKECAVLRILSPSSKDPAVLQTAISGYDHRKLVAVMHNIGLQTTIYPKRRRILWIPNPHRTYHLGFILFIYSFFLRFIFCIFIEWDREEGMGERGEDMQQRTRAGFKPGSLRLGLSLYGTHWNTLFIYVYKICLHYNPFKSQSLARPTGSLKFNLLAWYMYTVCRPTIN